MGTYLVFHLGDWSQVKKCHLVLNGIEQVPRSAVPAKVNLQRILHSQPLQQPVPPLESTPQSPTHLSPSIPPITQEEQLTNGSALKKTTSLSPRANTSHPAKPPPPVVRKRLSADITVLLDPPPENNVLVLLLKPAEETQAWQFLSACMQVTQCGNKPLVMEGTGSMKKALTRTKPLYFSKNGNVQRI
ncbi:hypothetical protein C7M84_000353 [Penaeus vannamei]|uniref:Uncharacterized protein n=1 Tax=Penaeus vannamei TaxID=6689 RepID=A0A3R7MF92_PENVA|nr:hypothetical protein C7M84_000353 [Penaeus vannamei]